MFAEKAAVWFALCGSAALAQALPELRVEPVPGGSVFHVKNDSPKPLTGYLIELVNYPGSYYALWQDDVSAPIAPGAEKRIEVGNMTVGAVPDYVKVTAAIYLDGSSAGAPEKVAQFIERRKAVLATTRELENRLAKAQAAGTAKDAIIADLKQWADELQPPDRGRSARTQAGINQAASRAVILESASRLGGHSVETEVGVLHASELALATSRPPL